MRTPSRAGFVKWGIPGLLLTVGSYMGIYAGPFLIAGIVSLIIVAFRQRPVFPEIFGLFAGIGAALLVGAALLLSDPDCSLTGGTYGCAGNPLLYALAGLGLMLLMFLPLSAREVRPQQGGQST